MTPPPVKVTVHSQPGCHLCDEAIAWLEGIKGEYPSVEITVLDINRNDDSLKLYLERIPVVEIDGIVVSELVLEEDSVLERLGNPVSRSGQIP
ncbi:MAG: glutaredoxin family protein [Solirubrobacterales bacterium]